MAVPRTKDELLVAIADNYAKLSIDLGRVPASRAREASMPGHVAGTVMSPADLVSYLVGWNEQVLEWFTERQRGVEPDFPARGLGCGTSWASLPSASTPTMGSSPGHSCWIGLHGPNRGSSSWSVPTTTPNSMGGPGIAPTPPGG
ncbi:Hypothetical protein PFCIRM508_01730 [Propionibacterium freudenreichii]|nr:ClbS/DfsB family four-helix bundle protein [Propionibacterium freudenreichii]CEG85511.1 Hypothetical protein PFCIRM118_10190 [Propionibacterium freudenreichii]CEI24431.1 Hypothetical protein PFCIRM508_01730 [Propionibacterium freudenreichii]